MSVTTLQILIAGGLIAFYCGVVFLGIRRRRSTRAHYRAVFAARDILSASELAAAFAPPAGTDPDDVMAILEGASEYLDVAAGKLRPTDDFGGTLAAPGFSATTTARAMATLSYRRIKKKYPRVKDSPAEIRDLRDFVAAISRDIARVKQPG